MQKNIIDKYQERYLRHQERKRLSLTSNYGEEANKITKKEKEVLWKIFKGRCSQRVFNNKEITLEEIRLIIEAIKLAPSSCDRKGVGIKIITEREDREILSGLLVGGIGWIHRAGAILLLEAAKECYKNPAEKDFMPYLDAGVIIQTAYLACEGLNIGCCYVNPNVRERSKEFFRKIFDIQGIFCGAIIIGHYDKKHTKKNTSDMVGR